MEGKEFIDTGYPRERLVANIRAMAAKEDRDPAENKILEKLGFVSLRYAGFTIKEACETMGISVQTGYNWQNAWNRDGYASVSPRYAGGRSSRLDDGQREVLSAYVGSEYPSTRDAREFIAGRFGVEYSEKQVHVIMNSMGFEHVSEKNLDIDFERPEGRKKSLMRWVPPDCRYNLSKR